MLTKRIYLFSGTQYCRFDIASNAANSLQYPADIGRWWSGLPGGPIDAAINWGINRIYFFVGPDYYRFNVLTDQVDPGYPKPINGNWSGFAGTGFENGVDAAVNWGNGKAYFFRGDQYLRMDWNTSTVDAGYPKSIGQFWAGLAAAGFERDLDDVVNFGNGKAYLFKGPNYVRFDLATNAADPGYPQPIAPNWPGVFAGGINAATEWPVAKVDDNGGFRVPLNTSACQVVASGVDHAGNPLNKGGKSFQMEVDFVDTEYPMSKAAGQYRQYVRGHFLHNGHPRAHGLPPSTPGAPPVDMNDRVDPVTGQPGVFLEDGLTTPPAGMNTFYGHRLDLAGNADATDRYLPDRVIGGQYRGVDFPATRDNPGVAYSTNLDFIGQAVDASNPPPSAPAGEVLTSVQWSVDCSGML